MTRRLQGWRRFAAWSAIVAIVFHAALLLFHHPAQAHDESQTGTLVLCTTTGLKVVALADLSDLPPSDHEPSKSSVYYCPICLGAQLSSIAVVPDTFQFSKPDLATVEFARPRSDDVDIVRVRSGSLGSRAPPSIV